MQIGVLGSWETHLAPEIYHLAEEAGRLVAARGDTVLTGGGTGVMEAAMKGAGGEKGISVGFVPTERCADYESLGSYMDVRIMTGMGELGKMAPLIHSADGLIAIAGGAGTLAEIAMAYTEAKPVVLVPVPGHTTAAIRAMLDSGFLDYRRIVAISSAADAAEAVSTLYSRLGR